MSAGRDRARLTAAIIAGGRATRFGGAVKPLLEVDGRRILDRQLDALAPHCDEVVVCANDPAPFADTGLRVVADEVPGAGPLAGIAAALAASACDDVVVVAGDMPYISWDALAAVVAAGRGHDAACPVAGGRREPLFGFYSRGCLAVVRDRLAAGARAARALFDDPRLDVAFVTEDQLRAVDPHLCCLRNINCPDDLR